MKIVKKVTKTVLVMFCVIAVLVTILAVYNQIALKLEQKKIVPNGTLVALSDRMIHVYAEGENSENPTLVFLSGSATVAPVYDFKILYSKLSDEFRIAVVEKTGYGYSDIVNVERDIDTMLNEVRTALALSGETAPYVLIPHSMSGLEAIYWAQQYPDEVAAIVGLDMSTPESYDDFDFNKVNQMKFWGAASVKLGLLRIPGIYPLSTSALNNHEACQQNLLMYRNAVNTAYINEGNSVYSNAQTVKNGGLPACPVLMFSSNGDEIGDFWVSSQKQFANSVDAELIFYDCGHYIHYYKSDEIAEKIKCFISSSLNHE